jgi:pyrophosphatase PpaX
MPDRPPHAYRGVVFDLDGTLLDTVPLIVASHRHALLEVLGRDEPDAVLRAGIGRPLIDQMRIFDAAHADQLLASYVVWNRAHTADYVRWFPGVDDVLRALLAAGVQVAVATSKMREAVDLAFSIVPPPIAFDALVTLEDTDAHKPDPAPVRHAFDKLGVPAAEGAYVGDAAVDLEAAAAAGCAGIGVSWGVAGADGFGTAPAVGVARTPAELHDLVVGPGARAA